jgi:hypothetical protein
MRKITLETILQKAATGDRLSEVERLWALDALDAEGRHSTHELAKLLSVSDRQIRRDREKLRKLARLEFQSLDLAGEIWRQYRYTLERIDEAIKRQDHKSVRSLALRWGVVDSFAKLAAGLKLGEISSLIEQLKARAVTNGNLDAVSAN